MIGFKDPKILSGLNSVVVNMNIRAVISYIMMKKMKMLFFVRFLDFKFFLLLSFISNLEDDGKGTVVLKFSDNKTFH